MKRQLASKTRLNLRCLARTS